MTASAPQVQPSAARGTGKPPAGESLLLPVTTLVVWVGCVVVGALGWALPYAQAALVKREPPPVTAEVLQVELADVPTPPPSAVTPAVPKPSEPPSLVPPPAMPAPPAFTVAEPALQIAFAVPVAAPARIVEAKQASYRTPEVAPAPAPAPPAPAPQPLTFGLGEGRQPAPDYPLQARREGQEGIVTVRMFVGENGRVLAAEAASPSPWPLLNHAALRAVKSRWQFARGPVRSYEVAIRFQLNK